MSNRAHFLSFPLCEGKVSKKCYQALFSPKKRVEKRLHAVFKCCAARRISLSLGRVEEYPADAPYSGVISFIIGIKGNASREGGGKGGYLSPPTVSHTVHVRLMKRLPKSNPRCRNTNSREKRKRWRKATVVVALSSKIKQIDLVAVEMIDPVKKTRRRIVRVPRARSIFLRTSLTRYKTNAFYHYHSSIASLVN